MRSSSAAAQCPSGGMLLGWTVACEPEQPAAAAATTRTESPILVRSIMASSTDLGVSSSWKKQRPCPQSRRSKRAGASLNSEHFRPFLASQCPASYECIQYAESERPDRRSTDGAVGGAPRGC